MSEPIKICDSCKKAHLTHWGTQACRAHLSDGSGVGCRKPPVHSGLCRSHGAAAIAASPGHQQRMALMSAQGEIAELMRECDIPDQHPVEGLLEVVRVSGAMHRLLTIKVGELKEDPSIEEVLVDDEDGLRLKKIAGPDGFWGTNHNNEMVPHVFVQLLKIWSERHERACKTALDAGVAERQIRLAENQGELIATAVKGILNGLGLTPEQWKIAPKVVEAQMRLVADHKTIEGELEDVI